MLSWLAAWPAWSRLSAVNPSDAVQLTSAPVDTSVTRSPGRAIGLIQYLKAGPDQVRTHPRHEFSRSTRHARRLPTRSLFGRRQDAGTLAAGDKAVGRHRVAHPYTLTAPALRTGREPSQVCPEAFCLPRVMRGGANAAGCR